MLSFSSGPPHRAVLSAMETPLTDQKLSSSNWPRSHYCVNSHGLRTKCHYSKTEKIVGGAIAGGIALTLIIILLLLYCARCPWRCLRRTRRHNEVRLQELPTSSGNVQQPLHPESAPLPLYAAYTSIKRPDEEPVHSSSGQGVTAKAPSRCQPPV
ncbi:hypothetical protein DENSPDRAFT_214584 [Dentipellis sp. KUC8613]|nr:hypothetical protein DENSPDRAFT_214584 [Dentipellis sp. KUC8613]